MRAACGFAVLALATLGACGGGQTTEQISATPPSTTFRVTGSDLSDANAAAVRYCRQYEMGARLTSVTPDGTGGSTATYACVDR